MTSADSPLLTAPIGQLPVVGAGEPLRIRCDGEAFEVRRTWPGKKHTRIVELVDGTGRLRAGTCEAGAMLGDEMPQAGRPESAAPAPDLTAVLRLEEPGCDRKLPSLNGGDLLVHRAGKRAVERRGDLFVKHLRAGRAAGVAEASARMGAAAAAAGFSVPEAVATTADSVAFSTVPGAPLLDLDTAEWAAAWERFADLWSRFVLAGDAQAPGTAAAAGAARAGDPAGPESEQGQHAGDGLGDVHGREAESRIVADWCDHLRTYGAAAIAATHADALAAAEAAAHSALAELGEGSAPVLAHRDLHDGQLLFDPAGAGLGILDFDTAVAAERELDLANLAVHIRLRRLQGLVTAEAADVAEGAVLRAAEAVGADPRRMDAYRLATWVRLVGVYAFRPQWAGLARAVLDLLVDG